MYSTVVVENRLFLMDANSITPGLLAFDEQVYTL